MSYRRFAMFSVTAAATWVAGSCLLGYWFGNLPGVKRHFQYVILPIVILSIMPAVIEYLRERDRSRPGEMAAAKSPAVP